MVQRARELSIERPEGTTTPRFLIRDRDSKFTRSGATAVIRSPIQAPKANAHAVRWAQTVRSERLDCTFVLGRRPLVRLLRVCGRHDDQQRPHRGLALAVPDASGQDQDSMPVRPRDVRRRDVLGGLVHEYHAVAA